MKKILILSLSCLWINTIIYAQVRRVGINTTTPTAMLHVKDSSVVFTGIDPPPGIGNPPVSGSGTRMMWYADKGAFRAGNVSLGGATYWDKVNIGYYSIATGKNTKAMGYASVAMGEATTAIGDYSTSMGVATFASGNSSTAIGFSTLASGLSSIATGYQTVASGERSMAMGNTTRASGIGSTAMGIETLASGASSTAIGNSSTASGGTSTAMGFGTMASNNASTAIGILTTASGPASIAMGDGTTSSGGVSIAMGNRTTASGDVSTAMGNETTASGFASTAMGFHSIASGNFSIAIGNNTNAKSYTSLVAGRFNDTTNMSSTTIWIDTDPVFVIGNGTENNARANAFSVLKNGNTKINGELTADEVQRPATGVANLIPVCYGSVSDQAAINSGTGNFSVVKSATGRYDITITNETYSSIDYSTVITPVAFGSNAAIASSGITGNSLRIRLYDIPSGVLVDYPFSFVVYKQ